MTDITELAHSLKAAAEKASNADWVKESGDGWEAICSNDDRVNGGFIIAHFEGPDAAENREFVQAANPANILALVEALELKEEQRANWFQMAQKLGENLDAAEKRIAELESRTVTVKLPPRKNATDYVDDEFSNEDLAAIFNTCRLQCKVALGKALTAQGIKWEAE